MSDHQVLSGDLAAVMARRHMEERMSETPQSPPPVVEQQSDRPSATLPAGEVSFLSGLLGNTEDLSHLDRQVQPVVTEEQQGEALKKLLEKERKLTTEGAVKDWIMQQIDQAMQDLNLLDGNYPPDITSQIEDAVWSSAMSGKLGDGSCSTATANAIKDIVSQIAQTKVLPAKITDQPLAPAPVDQAVPVSEPVPMPNTGMGMAIPVETVGENIFEHMASRERPVVEQDNGGLGQPVEQPHEQPKKQATKLTELHKTAIKMWQTAHGSDWKSRLKDAWESGQYPDVDDLTANVLDQVKQITDGDLSGLKLDEAKPVIRRPVERPIRSQPIFREQHKPDQVDDPDVDLVLREGMARAVRKLVR